VLPAVAVYEQDEMGSSYSIYHRIKRKLKREEIATIGKGVFTG
jgi:hypothetical protein